MARNIPAASRVALPIIPARPVVHPSCVQVEQKLRARIAELQEYRAQVCVVQGRFCWVCTGGVFTAMVCIGWGCIALACVAVLRTRHPPHTQMCCLLLQGLRTFEQVDEHEALHEARRKKGALWGHVVTTVCMVRAG